MVGIRTVGVALGYLLAFQFSSGAFAGLFYREWYNTQLLEAVTRTRQLYETQPLFSGPR